MQGGITREGWNRRVGWRERMEEAEGEGRGGGRAGGWRGLQRESQLMPGHMRAYSPFFFFTSGANPE